MANNIQPNRQTSSKPRISLMVQDSPSVRRRYSCPSGLHLYRSVSMPKSEGSNPLDVDSEASSSTASSSEISPNEDTKLQKKERVQRGSIPLMGSLVYFKKRGESFPQTAEDEELHSEIMKLTDRLGRYQINSRKGDTPDRASLKSRSVSDPLAEEYCPLCDFSEIDDRMNEERRHSTEWMEKNLDLNNSGNERSRRNVGEGMKKQIVSHAPIQGGSKAAYRIPNPDRIPHHISTNHHHHHHHHHPHNHHLDKSSERHPDRASSSSSLNQEIPTPIERSGYRSSEDGNYTLGTSQDSRNSTLQYNRSTAKRRREHKRRLTCAVIFTQPRVVEI